MMDQLLANLIVVVGTGLVLGAMLALRWLLHQSVDLIVNSFPKRKDDDD